MEIIETILIFSIGFSVGFIIGTIIVYLILLEREMK